MNSRRNLLVALCAGALAAPLGSGAQQSSSAETPGSLFIPSATIADISYPEQSPAADVSFLKELTSEANSMSGKNADETVRIAKALQEKLDGVEMNLLLLRLDSNPNPVFRFRALEQIRMIRTYAETALAQAARIRESGSQASKAKSAQKK
jgi:hypothetical protein